MKKRKNQLLEKVERFIEEPPHEPEPPQPEKPVSQRSRNMALLRYFAIMFVAAFVLVLLSFLQQRRDSRQTISELSQNASSALTRAEQLQADNRALTEQNTELTEKNQDLTEQLSSLETQLQQLREEMEAVSNGTQEADQKIKDLEARLEEAENRQRESARAYELLLSARRALDEERVDDFIAAMSQLADMTSSLDTQGTAVYQELLKAGQKP